MNVPFDRLIELYGHDVFIRRRLNIRDGVSGEVLSNNEKYADELERHTGYRTMVSQVSVTGQPMVAEPEGFVSDLQVKFYLKPTSQIKSGDLIYEQTPHERHEYEMYRVTRSVPMYIANELKYFIALVERLDPVT